MRDRDPFGPYAPVSIAADFAVLARRYAKIQLTPRLDNLVKRWDVQRSIDRPMPEDRGRLFE